MRFRRKPETIEAFQPCEDDWPYWGEKAYREGIFEVNGAGYGHIIHLAEGDAMVYPGDYIIRGPDGCLTFCRLPEFDELYEKIDD